jgi:hypothetical protein
VDAGIGPRHPSRPSRAQQGAPGWGRMWVLGIGARMGFSIGVTHGGHASIAHFSATHDITSGAARAVGFISMALVEVIVRTGVLYAKAVRTGAEIPRGGLRQHLSAA